MTKTSVIRDGDSVLAIIVARIGDTLLATPALRALRAACGVGGRLTVLAHPRRTELLHGLPFIDHLAAITKLQAPWRGRLGRPRFQAAAVWGHDAPLVRYALRVAAHVVAPRQRDEALNRRLVEAVAPPPALLHAVDDRLRVARALGADTQDWRLAYRVGDDEARAAQATVEAGFGKLAGPLVGIQPNSFPTKPYRDWPAEHFAALLERLFARHAGARVLVLGDSQSAAVGGRLATQFPGKVESLAGRLRLRETAAVMARLDLYVGVDTGPTHLAGALGVPMVAMYHCRHRGVWLAPPQHPRLSVIEHPASDAECSERRSMTDIGVDVVWEAVAARLASLPRAAS